MRQTAMVLDRIDKIDRIAGTDLPSLSNPVNPVNPVKKTGVSNLCELGGPARCACGAERGGVGGGEARREKGRMAGRQGGNGRSHAPLISVSPELRRLRVKRTPPSGPFGLLRRGICRHPGFVAPSGCFWFNAKNAKDAKIPEASWCASLCDLCVRTFATFALKESSWRKRRSLNARSPSPATLPLPREAALRLKTKPVSNHKIKE